MRKLSTIRKIADLTPIEGADKIETAHIDGWTVVVGKGEFKVGQEVLFFEIDSMLPLDNPLFSFLEPRGVKEQNGIKYHRLKTAKLRGQISQGLVIPVPKEIENPEYDVDYSEQFEVIKYEQPIPLGGNLKAWPEWISHTDEERIQNFTGKELEEIFDNATGFVPTEKIDGTSCTIWCRSDLLDFPEAGVCSRRYGLEYDDNNVYWKMAMTPSIKYGDNVLSPITYIKNKHDELLSKDGQKHTVVLQGEVFGEGIQSNPLGVSGQHIRFFNLIVDGELKSLLDVETDYPELKERWVPVHEYDLPVNAEEIISMPDGVMSKVPEAQPNKQIEGFVWRNVRKPYLDVKKDIDWSKIPEDKCELVTEKQKSNKIRASFKAISNKYLLKHDG